MIAPERIWKCAGCGEALPSKCNCVTDVAVIWEPQFKAILKSDLRIETVSENIARDISEGRFPERSERLMVRKTGENTIQPGITLAEALALPEIAALVEAALPYISPVQTADFGRQLRQHDALVAALAAITKGNAND